MYKLIVTTKNRDNFIDVEYKESQQPDVLEFIAEELMRQEQIIDWRLEKE